MFKCLLCGQKDGYLTVRNNIATGSDMVKCGLVLCCKCVPKKLNRDCISINQRICCMIRGTSLFE